MDTYPYEIMDKCPHRENTLKNVSSINERVNLFKKNIIVIAETNKIPAAPREETHINRVNNRVQNKNYQQKERRNQKKTRNREKPS